MEFEKKVCPDCNGSGVYQEYDEYDRYTVHSCATCDGSGEIAHQSIKSEEVQVAHRQNRRRTEEPCDYCKSGIDTVSLMDSNMIMRFVSPVNYCPNCGQAIDWSEE